MFTFNYNFILYNLNILMYKFNIFIFIIKFENLNEI